MSDTPNYPDVLGYITGGKRHNVNVVQVALGVRPRVVRAGRPFEAVLLVQNASDVNVDVAVMMEVPERDAKKQKGKFTTGKNRLVIGLRPAEMGYIKLPVNSQPDTAVDNDYRISMEVKVKPLDKPGRVRLAEGGGQVVLENLRPETIEQIEELSKLNFSADKRFGLRDVLEVSFSVMPGRLGQIAPLQPGWVNLWSMSDHRDPEVLLERYGPKIVEQALPKLKREYTFVPLLESTRTQFAAAGYPLILGEAVMIAKLLTFVLEMANPQEHTVNSYANAAFDIPVIMQKHQDGLSENIPPFPLWFDGLLHQVAGNEDLLRAPAQVVGKLLYTQLLRDTVPYAFELIKRATGEDLGTPAEVDQYSSQLVQRLEHKSGMDFAHTYMPLVLAGLIVYEQVPLKDEELLQTLRDVTEALMERDGDLTDEDEPIYEITKQIINRSAKQFGFEI